MQKWTAAGRRSPGLLFQASLDATLSTTVGHPYTLLVSIVVIFSAGICIISGPPRSLAQRLGHICQAGRLENIYSSPADCDEVVLGLRNRAAIIFLYIASMISTRWGGLAARAAYLMSTLLSRRADQATYAANGFDAFKVLQAGITRRLASGTRRGGGTARTG